LENRVFAVCVVKSGDLFESYSLTIDQGKVTAINSLTRAQDLPAIAIGLAQRDLWVQARSNRELPNVSKQKN
jgi:hypothetical protein